MSLTKIDMKDVMLEMPRYVRNEIKVLASLEGQSMKEWVAWIVGKAYEAKMLAKKK